MDTSNQLDCYLDAIVRSSMAVADMSHDDSRDSIVEACQNVSIILITVLNCLANGGFFPDPVFLEFQ